MYDIHCHILYGVDDGADSLSEAVEMLRRAYEGGTVAVAATPHSNVPKLYENSWNSGLEKKLEELRKALEHANIPLELYRGQEIFCCGSFIEKLKSGELITLNGSRYPLVEFRFDERAEDVYKKLGLLIAEGYVPVVAHPERYRFVAESPEAAKRLKAMGCLLQINKGSILGKFGAEVKAIAHTILSKELACAVASDGHSPYMRTPFLADVHEAISERYSADYADVLLSDNPKAILNDKLPIIGV